MEVGFALHLTFDAYLHVCMFHMLFMYRWNGFYKKLEFICHSFGKCLEWKNTGIGFSGFSFLVSDLFFGVSCFVYANATAGNSKVGEYVWTFFSSNSYTWNFGAYFTLIYQNKTFKE